jgi:hypothetical protein
VQRSALVIDVITCARLKRRREHDRCAVQWAGLS